MLYDIGFFIFSLLYLPTLLFKGKLHRDFLQRFGNYDEKTKSALASRKEKIWIQAVSVGEVALCKTFIPLLKNEYPKAEIVLSTITKTGNDLAKKIFSKDVTIIYFPLDFRFVVNKVAGLIKPKLYVMIETEIWPNLLNALYRMSVPSALINGRISDRSIGKYRLARPFIKKTLNRLNIFCMQTKADAERIVELGAPSEKVKVTGNMKFDTASKRDMRPGEEIREVLNLEADEELVVAGSTHKGEEEILLEAFKELSPEFPKLKLLIAPRHIDRIGEIDRLVKRLGLEAVKVSDGRMVGASKVLILDAIGQLNDIYSIATIVFIGGSLVRHGGHNPIEPALFEKPVLFGPHMFNFKTIASSFLSTRAAVQVTAVNDIVSECRFLLRDESERMRLGTSARSLVIKNCGAAKRNIDAIKEIIG